jgi:hypothetical protein
MFIIMKSNSAPSMIPISLGDPPRADPKRESFISRSTSLARNTTKPAPPALDEGGLGTVSPQHRVGIGFQLVNRNDGNSDGVRFGCSGFDLSIGHGSPA